MKTFLMGIILLKCRLTTTSNFTQSTVATNASTSTQQENGNSETNDKEWTLEAVCLELNIYGANCTCTEPKGYLIELCAFFDNFEETTDESLMPSKIICETSTHLIIGVANLISAVLALIGNGLVIGLTVPNWSSFTRFRHLITALAITDFLFAIIQFITNLPKLWTCHWVYNLILCKIFRSGQAAIALMSLGFVFIIAVDRYFGIVHSFKSWMTSRKIALLSIINVFLAMATVVPTMVYLQLGTYNICSEIWPENSKGSLYYTWFLFIFYFIVPIVAISAIYIKMILWLKQKLRMNRVLSDQQQSVRLKANKRIMVILVSILVLFFILVLPNKLVWIVIDHVGVDNIDQGTLNLLNMFSLIPYGFHIVVNPIIYSLVDQKFRKQLSNLFFKFLKRPLTLVLQSNQGVYTLQQAKVTSN